MHVTCRWYTQHLFSATSSHACFCSIEGGGAVAKGKAIWDVVDFQFLLQRHPASEELLAGIVMAVVMASTPSLRTPVETLEYDLTMLRCACVVPLLRVVARNLSLG